MASWNRTGWGHSRRRRASARSWFLVLAGITALLVPVQFGGVASAQGGVPGTLDPTFDTDGIAINELVSNLSAVDDSARLPDGRVLVLADEYVWRFFADGTLDTSFDLDGVMRPPSSLRAGQLALRPGGGFVLSSGSNFDSSCPAGRVAQFDANGAIVTAFGASGVACINFPTFSTGGDLAVQADDQVLVLGDIAATQTVGARIALARLSATGQTVNTVTQALSGSSFETGEELAIQADGNIVVAGTTNTFPDYSVIGVVLSRYLGSTLALDTTFGGGDGINVLATSLDDSGAPVELARRPDGLGMSVVFAGDNTVGEGTVPAMEQLITDANGLPSDSPVVVELPDTTFAVMDDLTATATGYVATGHYADSTTSPTSNGMFAVALGQGFTGADPVLISHPSADLAMAGGASLLLPDGKLLHASVFEGPAGEQLLFNRLTETVSADSRTVALDPTIGSSFGQPGFLTLNALTGDRGHGVATQPDGKVLVGGVSRTANAGRETTIGNDGFVLRHNEDGSLDATFGGPQRPGVAFVNFSVNGVALAPDGRVVAVGSTSYNSDAGGGNRGTVQRLLANGTPDSGWNDGQPVNVSPGTTTPPETFFRDVAVQPDGKVVAVGDYHTVQTCDADGCTSQNWIVVARFVEDGGLDLAFGDEGFALIGPVPGSGTDLNAQFQLAQGRGIALQPDGRIVVTGNLGSQLAVARLDAGGAPDPTFAAPPGAFGPGVLVDDLVVGTDTDRSLGRDVALHPDGRIVVSGDLTVLDCSNVIACFNRTTAVAVQYQPGGARDGSFGTGGLALITATPSEGHGVAVDGVGNVVVGGTATVPGTGSDVLLARLSPAGVADTGFGTNGVVFTDVDQTDAGNGLALGPDGRIFVAGVNSDSRGDRVLTARYEPGAALQCAPSPLDFGAVVLGTGAVNQPVTCTNTGPSTVTITAITTSGTNAAEYVPSAGSCLVPLAPGQSCQAPVAFTPTAVGARTAVLSVAHTGQGVAGPISVGLLGTGIARDTTLSFDPTPLTFAEQLGLSTSPAQIVTVTNLGTVPITINGVSIENDPSGDFAIPASTCTGVALPPGGSCQVSVTFTPKAPGGRAATLRFDDTGVGAPHGLPLSGTGATPTVAVNPGLGRPGTVTVATGAKFPPGQSITMVWVEPGTLLDGGFPEPDFTVTTNADGTFTATMIAFPKSRIGTRALLAEIGAFGANTPFLVTPGSLQGPDYVYRR